MNLYFSMVAFALASSLSPGPVNLVALSSGARYGFSASLRHISGATIGFTLLLLLIGLGLHALLSQLPYLDQAIHYAGMAFLLFIAYKLARSDGEFAQQSSAPPPSFLHGAIMQWLNPKAWLASLAGMGAYAASGSTLLVGQFALIYFVVCYGSLACWGYAGSLLQHQLRHSGRMRLFNRVLAALLVGSAVYLL
ncbi:LysE family translocator [Neisseriaceae bacterium TC5R-5]|nr:LysE family translocator [Neisseriaceae bacterium TC5R-5]